MLHLTFCLLVILLDLSQKAEKRERKRCGTHGRSDGAWNWISDFQQTIFSGEYGKSNRLKANPFCQPTIFSTNRNGHGRKRCGTHGRSDGAWNWISDFRQTIFSGEYVARDKAYTWMYVAKSSKCFSSFCLPR